VTPNTSGGPGSVSCVGLRQNLISQYQDTVNATPAVAMSYLYSFFNEANIAIDQANNKNLNQFIDYMLDNATSLRAKHKNNCYFSRWKYKKQEVNQFYQFIATVKYLTKYTRNLYEKKLNTSFVPFVYVSHDGWDSKDNDMMGVSIHFIVPGYWQPISVAVGLKRYYNKTSKNMAAVIMSVLEA
jgi:hypothetical protein